MVLLYTLFQADRAWVIMLIIVGVLGLGVMALYVVTVFTSSVDVPRVSSIHDRPAEITANGFPKYKITLTGAIKVTVRPVSSSRNSILKISFLDTRGSEVSALVTDFFIHREKKARAAAQEIADQLGLFYEEYVPVQPEDPSDSSSAQDSAQ